MMLQIARSISEFAHALAGSGYDADVDLILFSCIAAAGIAFCALCAQVTARALTGGPMSNLFRKARKQLKSASHSVSSSLTYEPEVGKWGERIVPYVTLQVGVLMGGYLLVLSTLVAIIALLHTLTHRDVPPELLAKSFAVWIGGSLAARLYFVDASKAWREIKQSRRSLGAEDLHK